MVALQNDAFGLNLWRFVSGIGLGLEMVTIGAYLSEMAPAPMRGRAFAASQAIGFCSVPVISALAYFLVPLKPLGLDGWRWVVLAGAAAAIVIGMLRFFLPESPRWLARHGRLAEADEILARVEARVEAELGRPLPPPGPPEPVSTVGSFADLWRPPTRARVILMSAFNVFQTVGFYGFQNWVPTLLIAQGVEITRTFSYTTIIALAAPVGPLLGFFLGDRIERKWVIVGSAGLILVCGLAFGATTYAPLIIAMGLMLQVAANGMSYSFHAYQQELFPTGLRARASGFVYSWSRLSVIFSSYVIAYLLKTFGVGGVFAFIAGAMALVMAIIGVYGPRTSGVALEKISG
jgi:putative MFS transporter